MARGTAAADCSGRGRVDVAPTSVVSAQCAPKVTGVTRPLSRRSCTAQRVPGLQIVIPWQARALAAAPIAPKKMTLIAQAVYRKCDAKDGLEDGLLADPRTCDFDPAADLPRCNGDREADECFTSAQIAALKTIYGGIISNGRLFFPGLLPGTEKAGIDSTTLRQKVGGWDFWIIDSSGPSRLLQYGESYARYLAFAKTDPNFDWRKFDFDKDLARTGDMRAPLDATNPDLSEFKSRDGKVLMYFGWADTALSPLMGIDYYEKVAVKSGPATRDFYRLFIVPGMFHCRGGFGTDRFDRRW
jgi:feruloyl esterase